MNGTKPSDPKPVSASGGVYPFKRKPSNFGLVSINEAYMSDLHKPKLVRPENGQRQAQHLPNAS